MSNACVAMATTGATPTVTAVALDASTGTFTVTGTHLDSVTEATLSGAGTSASLQVQAGATATSLVAKAASALSLAAGVAYSLVVSNAQAESTPVTVSYTIAAGSVTPAMLDTAYLPAAGGTVSGNLTVSGAVGLPLIKCLGTSGASGAVGTSSSGAACTYNSTAQLIEITCPTGYVAISGSCYDDSYTALYHVGLQYNGTTTLASPTWVCEAGGTVQASALCLKVP